VPSTRRRWLALTLSAVLGAATLTAVSQVPRAQAAELPGSIVDGGYIISDAEFYRSGSMSESQIQTFLNGKAGSCAAGATCLKNYRGEITGRKADSYCKAIPAEKNATAARMIFRAAGACGINPRVILVMLQKEQGLVTSRNPSDWNLEHAMGQSCPDTPAGCSAAAAGFWNQVYLGSRQMQIYTKYPNSFSYRAGQYNTIKWSPSSACGSSKVFIKNQATANLYNYTPYRPNIAALAAGWATGDACSTYGNRNFYNYYVAWFAPGTSTSTGAPAQVGACTRPSAADVSTRHQMGRVNAATLNARTAPTTSCGSGIRSLAKGTSIVVTGVYGAWSQITVGGSTAWVVSQYLKLDAPSADGAPAVIGCAQPADVTGASGTAVVTVSALNARTAPSTACAAGVSSIRQGARYSRTGTYGAWWRLTIGGKSMWAHSDYLALEQPAPAPKPASSPHPTPAPKPTSSPKPTTPSKPATPTAPAAAMKTVAALNLRAGGSTSAKVLRVIPRGGIVTVLKSAAGWSQVRYASTTGWVSTRYLTAAPKSTAPKPAATNATMKTIAALNLRASGSSSAKILLVLPRGASVTVVKTSGSWSQVRYGARSGWVSNQYLA